MSVINTNITAMIGQQNLNQSQNDLSTSMERLSSGLKINSAADDAAGQAIANRMSSQINGLSQAQSNANDGISVAQTAEGALNQVNDNLQRVRELTVQAQNGTNSESDLSSIQDEIDQRLGEIDRISEETNFNGVKVLAEDQELSIQVGANDGESINLNMKEVNSETLELGNFSVASGINTDEVGGNDVTSARLGAETTLSTDTGEVKDTNGDITNLESVDGYGENNDGKLYAEITVDSSTEYREVNSVAEDGSVTLASSAEGSEPTDFSSNSVTTANAGAEVSLQDSDGNEAKGVREYSGTEDGAPEFVIADNSGENTVHYEAEIADDGTVTQGDELRTGGSATSDPLAALDSALSDVDSQRSELGAMQNRFDSAITNLSTTETNITSARSRIEDADYADEVSNMTKNQILQQAGTSVLSQANQLPQNALSLLGG
ncbi:FliC/FljB family flagellin [Chromohalobacter sp. 296-RDG]|uniref:FliC/FljB family flagellin n=1 Tax=Chromohalobacter sp. 296-RDG TaxID=2994062 RepID=UPI002469B737|nr:FliC/FljB family flagellin [Chromohalobacter sp. 296-RDG]